MEEAVAKIGLRADCASLIWNIYLDFEKMILNSMSGENDDMQRKCVESLYGRLLSVPHLDIQESWKDYKAFAGNFDLCLAPFFCLIECYLETSIVTYLKNFV